MKKHFLIYLIAFVPFFASAQLTPVKTIVSRVTDSTATVPSGWGAIRFNAQRTVPAWQFYNGSSWQLLGSGGSDTTLYWKTGGTSNLTDNVRIYGKRYVGLGGFYDSQRLQGFYSAVQDSTNTERKGSFYFIGGYYTLEATDTITGEYSKIETNIGSANIATSLWHEYNDTQSRIRLLRDSVSLESETSNVDRARIILKPNGGAGAMSVFLGGQDYLRMTPTLSKFYNDLEVPDEAYDATGWNGSLEVPTKNAIRDKIETMGGGGSGTVNSGTQYRLGYYAATGTAISEAAAITANRALISDANGVPTHSSVTATELGYLSGLTSSAQTQLGTKWSLANGGTLTGANTITGSTTNTLRFDIPSIGTSQTNQSFVLGNTTAASSGNQQYSPILWQIGNGWKTNATAASQTVAFGEQVVPIQGAASPTGYKSFFSSINGGSNSEILRLRNDGVVFLTGGSGFSASLYFGTGTDAFISRGTSGTQPLVVYGPNATANIYTWNISSFSSNNYSPTSGTGGSLGLIGNFNPSSGSANMYFANANGTINMTGTSSGNVFGYGVTQTVTAARGNYTGFYYNPTVTSVLGTENAFHATRSDIQLDAGKTKVTPSSDKISLVVTSTNGTYTEKYLTGTASATGFSETIVSSSEISDGQAVTIRVLWTLKDLSNNTSMGGEFFSTWSKASGTLAKAGDYNTNPFNDNATGTITIDTSDSSGNIAFTTTPSGVNNYKFTGHISIIKTN